MLAETHDRNEFAADFRVGDWLAEPSLDRLSRNGTVLRIRPQLMDLLVVLAQHAGRTVSKDVILDTVWQGQHVAESGMTRCIAEIRQALEDDAREPKMVQTIPKRGYRLVAPVEFLPAGGSSGAEAAPAVREPVPAAEPASPAPAPPPAEVQPDRQPLPRHVGWTMGSVLGVSLLAALTWGATGWSRTAVLSERDTVLLADFLNTTGDKAFDGTLRLALAVNLGQAPFLHILSDEHLRSALRLTGRPASQPLVGAMALEICRREGAAVLLAGSIARLGTHYAVGIEAIACRSGEPIGRELLEVANKEAVLTELGAATVRLRRTLGESRASLLKYDVPIVRATTPSIEALQALSLGDLSRDHSRLDDALSHYRRATDLDPQFALAWARRGAIARNLDLPDEAIPAFRKAYELRDRVSEPERFYILGHYYRFVADDPDKAADTYRMWQRIYPGSAVPPTNLASLTVNTLGRYAEALPEAREAVRLAPYSSVAARMLILAYLGSNRVTEAKQALREAASRGIADALWHELAFQIAFMDGDAGAMQEQVRWAAGSPLTAVTMTRNRALAAASAGRLREARRLWSEATTTSLQLSPSVRQARVRLWEAEAEALLGDPRRARLAADAAARIHPQPDTMLDAATAVAITGDYSRAAELIDQAVRRTEPGINAWTVWLHVSRALVDAGSGRPDRARTRIGDAARYERGWEFALSPLGVRAVIELGGGRPQDAAATFRTLLDLRAVLPTSPWVPFARLGLARALRDAGDAAGSRAAYDVFLESMKDADTDAPLVVAAIRERAAVSGR